MSAPRIEPLGVIVLLKRIEDEAAAGISVGGIHIPVTAKADELALCEVIASGPGDKDNVSKLKSGDKILIHPSALMPYRHGADFACHFTKLVNVLAIVHEAEAEAEG